MKLFETRFVAPAENLACDEALLDLCDDAEVETLRFWESRAHFIVVGYGNHVEAEVNTAACRERNIAILRRCTGGGTVVQGPGCLNYTLALRIPESGPLTTVTGTNRFIMERNRAALEPLLGAPVSVQGHTDLAILERTQQQWLKFSGNAQRRKRRAVLFHGTILYCFDLPLVGALLAMPSKQPDYRQTRGHDEFVTNVSANPDDLRRALQSAWNAMETRTAEALDDRISLLLAEKYNRASWNLRR